MARLVDASKGEVAILARLAVLLSVNKEGSVPGGLELLAVLVLGGEGDGLAAEPVADVISVTVDQGDAHGAGEDILQVLEEVGPDEVTGLLEGEVDLVVGHGVVEVDADGVLDVVLAQVVDKVARGCGIIVRVTDVVDTTAAEDVVRALCRRKGQLDKG